jgi:hypothetical protein
MAGIESEGALGDQTIAAEAAARIVFMEQQSTQRRGSIGPKSEQNVRLLKGRAAARQPLVLLTSNSRLDPV